jgi:hypothetical protein
MAASKKARTRAKTAARKKGRRGLTVDELCEILRKVAKSKVGYIVRNSPFKRPRASEASLPSR